MSSTTDRSARGQALAIFALSLTAVLLAAALAFDGGLVMVERRDQQNAADAAALAGARFLTGNTPTAKLQATDAAQKIATSNGFTDGAASANVDVFIPPVSGPHKGRSGYIEVQISSTRPSVFAGVAGIIDWDVGARAVALNGDGAGGDFVILALDPTNCSAFKVTGTGKATARGDIQVNSTCPKGAMVAGGGGEISAVDLVLNKFNCSVVGPGPSSIEVNGGGKIDCVPNMGAQPLDDPLLFLAPPPVPGPAAAPFQVDPVTGLKITTGGEAIPDGCPGDKKKPPSLDSPQKCTFKGNTYRPTTWQLSPGLYPGGLDLSDGTFWFQPGIYYIAGGGINIGGGGATARSLDVSDNLINVGAPLPTATHGVMFYNSDHPTDPSKSPWADAQFNGGFADFQLLPLSYPTTEPESDYNGIVFFNDRDYPSSPTAKSLTLNGGGSNFEVRGTVYSPKGLITVNGNSGSAEFTMDQVIAYNYSLNGNGGSIMALNDTDYIFKLRAAGLIE